MSKDWYKCPYCGESLRRSGGRRKLICSFCARSSRGHDPEDKKCVCEACRWKRFKERIERTKITYREEQP